MFVFNIKSVRPSYGPKNTKFWQFPSENPCILKKNGIRIFLKLLRGYKNECEAIYKLPEVIYIIDKVISR